MWFLAFLLAQILTISDTVSVISMHRFLPAEVRGWVLQQEERSYPGDAIFDYMNGAGEIYRAYHFNDLLVAQYRSPDGEEILVEVFDMGSSANAFGVFTHIRGQGTSVETGQGGEYAGGLLCFWKGRYFVCAKTEHESTQIQAAVLEIGERISRNIPAAAELPEILRYLPEGAYHSESLRYFFRNEILEMHYFVAESNLLHLDGRTEGVLVPLKADESLLLLIRYPDHDAATTAYDDFRTHYLPEAEDDRAVRTENGKWTACVVKGRFVAVVFDAATHTGAESCLRRLERRLP